MPSLRRPCVALAVAAAALAAFAPGALAAKKIKIEGFKAAESSNSSVIPRPVALPGGKLTKCTKPDAIMVIYQYSGMNDKVDKIRVIWYRPNAPAGQRLFYSGKGFSPDGPVGRAYRSLSPGVPNGVYRADVLVNNVVKARATVNKQCPKVNG